MVKHAGAESRSRARQGRTLVCDGQSNVDRSELGDAGLGNPDQQLYPERGRQCRSGVWSNTNPNGTIWNTDPNFGHCSNWTVGTAGPAGGGATTFPSGGTWSTVAAYGCEQSKGLYCFQQ